MVVTSSELSKVRCPRCDGDHIWSDGKRTTASGVRQRYLCRECGYRFSLRRDLNLVSHSSLCQVCDSDRRSKNLSSVEINQTSENVSEKQQILLEYAWWMKKQGLADQTIQGRTSILRTLLNRQVNIDNSESVKEYLASQECSNGRKRNIVHAISAYYTMKEKTWNPPKYTRVPKIPWIPQEKQVDQLIAAILGKYKPCLQILKETGMRPGEAWQLKWKDIDYNTKQVRITPEKGSNPRILPISNELVLMLNLLQRNTEYVFKKVNTGTLARASENT